MLSRADWLSHRCGRILRWMRMLFVLTMLAGTAAGCTARSWTLPPQGVFVRTVVTPLDGCHEGSMYRLPPVRATDTLTLEGTHRRMLGAIGPFNAWLARRVPGGWSYGPLSGPGDEPSILFMKDPTQKRAALIALDSLQRPPPWFAHPRRDTVEAVQVRWDWAELYDWQVYVMNHWQRAHAGGARWRSLGINYLHHAKISIGIEDVMGLPAVVRLLQELNVPCDLFHVEVVGEIVVGPAMGSPAASPAPPRVWGVHARPATH